MNTGCHPTLAFISLAASMSDEQWKRWTRQFPWLRGTRRSARCAQCPNFKCKDPQKSQLAQHEKGRGHGSSDKGSPSTEAFSNLIDERLKQVSLRKAKAGPHQSIKMMWCCNEALKNVVKQRIRNGLTSSITQDGQGTTLTVRLCTVSRQRPLTFVQEAQA